MFAFAGFVEVEARDAYDFNAVLEPRLIAVAEVREVVHIPDYIVSPPRTAAPNDCWVDTAMGRLYVAETYADMCRLLTETARKTLLGGTDE